MQKVHKIFAFHIDIAQSKNSGFSSLKGEHENPLN